MIIYDNIKSVVVPLIPKIIISLIIFVVANIIANRITEMIPNNDGDIVKHQIKIIIYYSIMTFAVVFILINFGFETSTIIAFLGAIVITLALAFQSLISNVVASVYILFNKLFNLGDDIEIGSAQGKVVDINLINTTLINSENKVTVIPNSNFLSSPLLNNSRKI